MSIPLPRRNSPESWEDPWLAHSIREVAQQYADTVTVKDKSRRQFGRATVATSGVRTTIALLPGTETGETFVTTNAIDAIVSSSAADTSTVSIEGHTIDLSGNLTAVTQTAVLTGQTPVTLTTPLARVNRVTIAAGTFATPATPLVGIIPVYASSGVTVTAGVVQTDSAVKIEIAAGKQTSEKASYSMASTEYGVLMGVTASILSGSPSSTVEIEAEIRVLGGAWVPFGLELSLSDGAQPWESLHLKPYDIIPPNADVRLVATASANNTIVAGAMDLAILTTS